MRDGRLYARGASDDKGNFLPLLHVACELARAGELPVHVRVVLEGEEEVGGSNVLRFVDDDERGADCAIVFDGGMIDEAHPALDIAVRGAIMAAHLRVRTAERDLHSGVYGGVALNAVARARRRCSRTCCPAPTAGRATSCAPGCGSRAPRRSPRGPSCPSAPTCWPRRAPARSRPGAAAELYARTWADTSVDVNGIESGDALQRRTIIPCTASARLSVRVALGQARPEIAAALERILREAAPAGRRDRARRRRLASRPASTPGIRCSPRPRGDRPCRGHAAAARAQRRLDPDPGRAREARHPDGRCPASRSTPTASTGRTRATGSRASRSARRAARELYAALATLS